LRGSNNTPIFIFPFLFLIFSLMHIMESVTEEEIKDKFSQVTVENCPSGTIPWILGHSVMKAHTAEGFGTRMFEHREGESQR
jgi:hypothetical protein